jgi:hypothetical protein
MFRGRHIAPAGCDIRTHRAWPAHGEECVVKEIVLALAVALTLQAQDRLSGSWQGETSSGRPVTLELKVAAGGTLTGAITLVKESEPISDGTVDRNRFSFKAGVEGQAATFTGELAGDQIRLAAEGVMEPLVLKRMK